MSRPWRMLGLLVLAACGGASAPSDQAGPDSPGRDDVSDNPSDPGESPPPDPWVIGVRGGRVSEDTFQLEVPAGAVSEPTRFRIDRIDAQPALRINAVEACLDLGPVYQLRPSGIEFDPPLGVTLSYAAFEEALGGWVRYLAVVRRSGGESTLLPSSLDPAAKTVHAATPHFSGFGLALPFSAVPCDTLPLLSDSCADGGEWACVLREWMADRHVCCGDGRVEATETCETGSTQACVTLQGYSGSRRCLSDCSGWDECVVEGQCGNGTIEGTETCDGGTIPCSDGCYDGVRQCLPDCGAWGPCLLGGRLCGNRLLEGCEICDRDALPCNEGGYPGSRSCLPDCSGYGFCAIGAQECGNGLVEGGEACDGGVMACADGCYRGTRPCLADCSGFAASCDTGGQRCGNGAIEGCERCDGDARFCVRGCYGGMQRCLPDCSGYTDCDTGIQSCGNGAREGCEVCDDGPLTGIAGSSLCSRNCCALCGNGVREAHEVCDDGDNEDCTWICNAFCTGTAPIPVCGNGARECGEFCDDGDADECTGACNADCSDLGRFPRCGDGIRECSESCDDGVNSGQCGSCRPDCSGAASCQPVCPNGVVEGDEACDDGNAAAGDGCDGQCRLECTPAVEYIASASAKAIDVDADYLYLGYSDGRFEVRDRAPLTDPPVLVGSAMIAASPIVDVVVRGGRAYVAVIQPGLLVVDVTDPANPVLIGRYDSVGEGWGVDADASNAFLATENGGLDIFDIVNGACAVAATPCLLANGTADCPAGETCNPNFIVNYNTPGYAAEVTLAGNRAYVADGAAGVRILDITNPAAPVEVGGYDTPGFSRNVRLEGTRAWVADQTAGVLVLEVSNPASPTLLGSFDTPEEAWDVALAGPYAFVADYDPGAVSSSLRAYNVSDLSNPILVGVHPTGGRVRRVIAMDGEIYLADYQGGLVIVHQGDCAP